MPPEPDLSAEGRHWPAENQSFRVSIHSHSLTVPSLQTHSLTPSLMHSLTDSSLQTLSLSYSLTHSPSLSLANSHTLPLSLELPDCLRPRQMPIQCGTHMDRSILTPFLPFLIHIEGPLPHQPPSSKPPCPFLPLWCMARASSVPSSSSCFRSSFPSFLG